MRSSDEGERYRVKVISGEMSAQTWLNQQANDGYELVKLAVVESPGSSSPRFCLVVENATIRDNLRR